MSYTYSVIVSTTKPSLVGDSYVWINPPAGKLHFKIGKWTEYLSVTPFTATEGTYNRTLEDQATEGTRQIGQIWRNSDIKQYAIFMEDWVSLLGGQ